MCIHEHVILISVQINKTIFYFILTVIFQNDKKNNQEYVLIGQIAI